MHAKTKNADAIRQFVRSRQATSKPATTKDVAEWISISEADALLELEDLRSVGIVYLDPSGSWRTST